MAGTAGTSARDTEIRLPRATVVKNKQPADKQVGSRLPKCKHVRPSHCCARAALLRDTCYL